MFISLQTVEKTKTNSDPGEFLPRIVPYNKKLLVEYNLFILQECLN